MDESSTIIRPNLVRTFADICRINGCLYTNVADCYNFFSDETKYPFNHHLKLFVSLQDSLLFTGSKLNFQLPNHQQYKPLKLYDLRHIAGVGHTARIDAISTFRNLFTIMFVYDTKRYVAFDFQPEYTYEKEIWYLLKSLHPQYKSDVKVQFLDLHVPDYTPFTLQTGVRLLQFVFPETDETDTPTPTAMHCSAGHGRTSAFLFLIIIYHFIKTKELRIDDPRIYYKLFNMRQTFGVIYTEEAAEEFFDIEPFEVILHQNPDHLHLLIKRLNIIIATIAMMELISNSSKHIGPTYQPIFLLDIRRVETIYADSDSYENPLDSLFKVKPIIRLIQYPIQPVSSYNPKSTFFDEYANIQTVNAVEGSKGGAKKTKTRKRKKRKIRRFSHH
jgi:hypothetical protein